MNHILVLTDFSLEAENALQFAFKLANLQNASMTIHHVMSEGEMVTFRLDQPDEIEFVDKKVNIASQYFEKWSNTTQKYGLEVNYVTTSGKILEEISKISDETNPDLIIMGNKGRDVSKNIWGSTTTAVIEMASSPVFVVSEPLDKLQLNNLVYASNFNVEEKEVFKKFLDLINPPKETLIHLLSVDTASFYNEPPSLILEAMRDFELLAYPFDVKKYQFTDISVGAGIRRFYENINADLLCISHHKKSAIVKFFTEDVIKNIVEKTNLPVLIMQR